MSGKIAPDLYRQVFGHLPTGVTVIAANGSAGPVGMSANSFTSVSLEPPLASFCPARTSTTWPAIREAGSFCASVLAAEQATLGRGFAARGIDRFDGVGWRETPAGPALDGAAAWVECRVTAEHDAGDHTIVVAAVTAMEADPEVAPLVFHRGGYGTFASG